LRKERNIEAMKVAFVGKGGSGKKHCRPLISRSLLPIKYCSTAQ
jgi:hypothetical protein